MIRLRMRRLGAALLALWFVVLIGEPAALHTCPMHSAAASSKSGNATHSGHVAHGAQGSHKESRGQACTCPGKCYGRLVTALPSAPLAIFASTQPSTETPTQLWHGYLEDWYDFVLPFANAPPLATA